MESRRTRGRPTMCLVGDLMDGTCAEIKKMRKTERNGRFQCRVPASR